MIFSYHNLRYKSCTCDMCPLYPLQVDIIFARSVYFTCWYPSIKPLPENNRAAPDNHSENACYPARNTLAIFTAGDPIQPVHGSTCVRSSTRRVSDDTLVRSRHLLARAKPGAE